MNRTGPNGIDLAENLTGGWIVTDENGYSVTLTDEQIEWLFGETQPADAWERFERSQKR